jgi:uncharacterized protein with PQ loop repeat
MIIIDKTVYYYLILFAILLLSFSFIPLVFEILQQKITSNIPYMSLICILISFLIYLFIAINRNYYMHAFFYLIGLISISIILFLKKEFDSTNTIIKKYEKNVIDDEENNVNYFFSKIIS